MLPRCDGRKEEHCLSEDTTRGKQSLRLLDLALRSILKTSHENATYKMGENVLKAQTQNEIAICNIIYKTHTPLCYLMYVGGGEKLVGEDVENKSPHLLRVRV